ncbi:HAD-superfamily hydrolase, subfamily IIB [Methylocella silvestris BL2]|uniref:Trehalose 6-phosphate phosphatase n=1 Tax=Methylocella silvestris (strain DSM 15510 / CIP 108128 / LMG 27833 / NCIMB 13906 / BL2) TaxID=395965 RepID=B8EN46_METSB|nr:trehalose-phosphatase [Methylocella silvestris]ACK49181.1 HAD-superfamily hydrolase, subfamily IIB [Methylocella silvestris BL2]
MVEAAKAPELLAPGELEKIAPPSTSAYFLDVDGTLLEIRQRPEDVLADAKLRALLGDIMGFCGGAVALVSGRAIADLDRIFDPLILPAAGLHGAEIRFPDGARTFADASAVDDARPKLRAFAQRHEGLRLEDKGATLALHFRQRPELAEEALAFMQALVDRPELSVQPGKMVAELKQTAHTKATGIASLMAGAPFLGRTPVFIGDDLTDEIGFGFVNEQGGVSIRIAAMEASTSAQFRLADPAQLRSQLTALRGQGA